MTLPKKYSLNRKKSSKIIYLPIALLFILFTGSITYAQAQYSPKSGDAAYTAEIGELNPDLTKEEVSGFANFIIKDGQLNITVAAKGLAPSIAHIQHFHGFKVSTKEAACPTPEADTNDDGIVDLIETHPHTGVTLIPFNDAPAELTILSESYPVANENGLSTYQISVSVESLKSAIQDAYGIGELSLANWVVYIHGVPEGTSLPETVQSLPDVPAQVTVPLACGEIEVL